MTDLKVAQKYISLSTNANSRKLEFSLTLNHVRKLLTAKKCYFTGAVFTDSVKRTVDRLDASKGYTIENTVACTLEFNQKKNNLTAEEIKMMYNALKRKKLA